MALKHYEESRGKVERIQPNDRRMQNNPPMLLGRDMYENSNMDLSLNAAASENNYLLLYGDFQQNTSSIVWAARSKWCHTCSDPTAGQPASAARSCGSAPAQTW